MSIWPYIRSRADAVAYLLASPRFRSGSADSRPVGNNTRVRMRGDQAAAIRLHSTDVVVYYVDGAVELNSGGWRTVTTKDRINRHCPLGWRVWSERGVWWLGGHGDKQWVFADGVIIHSDGTVTGYGQNHAAEHKSALRGIKAYSEGYVRALVAGEVPRPSTGDCWYCLFREGCGNTQTGVLRSDGTVANATSVGPGWSGRTMGEITGNSHLREHVEQGYYVPSLLLRAIERYPVSGYAKAMLANIWSEPEARRPRFDLVDDICERQLRKSLARYLKAQMLGLQT